ncbi:type B 50S ribosomal protein L31 [Streptomyces sp. NPDC006624]|uniref:type B 50S ribosomal protein L31 n=1 Tax=unclassified Streptomyces TaxID=2593676 RepID=UPI0033B8BF94
MRHGIHPVSRPVVFRDRAAGFELLVPSTVGARQTVRWKDGRTYPVVDVEISSASHPFYTGTSRVVDTTGRVQRFERRYGGTAAQARH